MRDKGHYYLHYYYGYLDLVLLWELLVNMTAMQDE